LNGLADGAGAASGPLHPDADRPLSRPPGRSHVAPGPGQGRFCVPAGPPVAALDPGPGGAGWRPRRPWGGRGQAGWPRAPASGWFRRNRVWPLSSAPDWC